MRALMLFLCLMPSSSSRSPKIAGASPAVVLPGKQHSFKTISAKLLMQTCHTQAHAWRTFREHDEVGRPRSRADDEFPGLDDILDR